MSAQNDIQELLRMFTSRKLPMMTAMKNVQALQKENLKTIEQVAQAEFAIVEKALDNEKKLANFIQAACKAHGKKGLKRSSEAAGELGTSSSTKKPKLEPHKRDLDYSAMSADALESSLALPCFEDEEAIRKARIITNRAPLVLAFAVVLLRFTMPEQPPSSRLSLAQAIVSANSRSKALSLGIEKAPPGGEPVLSEGQPKVRIMSREIPVLKRGGYSWSEAGEGKEKEKSDPSTSATSSLEHQPVDDVKKSWTASRKVTSKQSSFVAHCSPLTSTSARADLIQSLMAQKPELETASHNAWAVRTKYGNSQLVQEASFDDGEQGCGKFMLQIMREADMTNSLVVLTRWWGGVMLGPDRWRIMRECVSEAISYQRRVSHLSGEALWGLDLEDKKMATTTLGMAIHRPEAARNYLLKAFDSAPEEPGSKGKRTVAAINEEKQENLGKLLGALGLLFQSWAGTLRKDELDSRAWSWYVAVRPEVDHGPSGWGAKGLLELSKILDLRKKV